LGARLGGQDQQGYPGLVPVLMCWGDAVLGVLGVLRVQKWRFVLLLLQLPAVQQSEQGKT
jgi:hypothetical protein